MKQLFLFLITFMCFGLYSQTSQDKLRALETPPASTDTIYPEIQSLSAQRASDCDCYISPDASYTEITDSFTSGFSFGFPELDDGYYGPVALPFDVCFYGTNYNSCYININGSISFGTGITAFNSVAFPNADNVLIAPFWGDVDLSGTGSVYFKLTADALYVNWESVGYFSAMTDKTNTFQLIVTDGTSTAVPTDNNVAFCYDDLDWTTGDASNGTNGFGGTPATVGANKGDGINYLQLGRFDIPSTIYDGPFNNNDGVDWLDDNAFFFNTCASGSNIPPIPLNLSNCDTVTACAGEEFTVEFLSPELGQITTVTADATNAPAFQVVTSTPGEIGRLTGKFDGDFNSFGLNTVILTATDDGTPPESTSIEVVYRIQGVKADFNINPTPARLFYDEVFSFIDQSLATSEDSVVAWYWDFGDAATDTNQNSSHAYADSGIYPVNLQLVSKLGCTSEITKFLTVLPDVSAPNVITPNSDNKNDLFKLAGLHYFPINTKLTVYNRWGGTVYQNENYQGNWNGISNQGKDLTEGTYYYICENPEWKSTLSGNVTIMR